MTEWWVWIQAGALVLLAADRWVWGRAWHEREVNRRLDEQDKRLVRHEETVQARLSKQDTLIDALHKGASDMADMIQKFIHTAELKQLTQDRDIKEINHDLQSLNRFVNRKTE